MREEYFKQKLEFEIELDQIRHAENINREKQRFLEKENQKQAKIAARQKMLLDRPNPFLKEIETCDRLISSCQLLKKTAGLVQTDETIKEEQK